jgi:hypothetical protein
MCITRYHLLRPIRVCRESHDLIAHGVPEFLLIYLLCQLSYIEHFNINIIFTGLMINI